MKRLIAFTLLIPALSACSMRTSLSPPTFRFDLLYSSVDTAFSESPAEGDDTGQLITEFTQSRNYAAFAKQAEAEGSMIYDWTDQGGKLRVGTKDAGVDTTAQGEQLSIVIRSVAEGITRALAAQASGGASEIPAIVGEILSED